MRIVKPPILLLLLAISALLPSQSLAVTIQAAADINGDGLIQISQSRYTPVDISSEDTPFLFWLNSDQDDLELYENWPHTSPDLSNETIGSLRDLEDFARLHILFNDLPTGEDHTNLWLGFHWQAGTKSHPGIRLWQAAEPDGGRRYLLNEQQGEAQLAFSKQHSALGIVKAQQTLTLRLSQFKLRHNKTMLPLLFEATNAGRGQLIISLYENETFLSSSIVHMELRPVKTFYDRKAVSWPENVTFPYQYKGQPPTPELEWGPETLGHDFVKPWYEDDNILVWLHGWIPHDDENYRRTLVFSFETMFKRLWHQGYRGRVIHFHWPTRKVRGAFGLLSSEYLGLKSAEALVDFASTLPVNKRLHITCHSLGGVILAESLRLGLDFDTAIFQVSAVPAEAFDSRPELIVPELANTPTPRESERWGWADHIGESNTRIYNFFNPQDLTWVGWNLAQKEAKPYWKPGRKYKYYGEQAIGEQARLKYWWWFSRPVKDKHEALAFLMNSKTQALGAEARVGGLVHQSFDLAQRPHSYGTDHVAMWRWNPQKVMPYFNLILDVLNVPYNSLSR